MLRPTRLNRTLCATVRSFHSAQATLSGHNKWSKIKEKKGLNDSKKSAAYTKANRDIINAVRVGGSADPEKNSALAAILRRLKDVPKENIQNALDKAIRKRDQGGENIVYEALAYNKVGLIIECATDNPTRTIGNIRHILNEHSARITPVRFMFDHTGLVKAIVRKEPDDLPATRLIDVALENGAVDFQEKPSTESETEFQFTCPPESLGQLTTALSAPGVCQTLLASEVAFVPVDTEQGGSDEDPDMATRITDLVRDLEDDEDTKRVWTSWTL